MDLVGGISCLKNTYAGSEGLLSILGCEIRLGACQEITVKSWIRKPPRRAGTGTIGRHPRGSGGPVVVDSRFRGNDVDSSAGQGGGTQQLY
jgi:hypothetical protein